MPVPAPVVPLAPVFPGVQTSGHAAGPPPPEESDEEVKLPKRLMRTSKMKPRVVETIINALLAGDTLQNAATAAGIHRKTLREWYQSGEADEKRGVRTVFRDFKDRVDIAQAAGKQRLINCVSAQAEEQWTAAAWLLKVKWPKEFGDTMRHVVEDEIDEYITFLESRLPADTLALVKEATRDFYTQPSGGPLELTDGNIVDGEVVDPGRESQSS